MKVTLYIPCYNAQNFIEECLEGVLKQTYKVDEILIIDDGSRDETVAIASRYPVKIIRHEKNKGLATARNTAFKNATGDFVASLDVDCVPDPDWLEKMMPEFNGEKVAGVGGKLLEKFSERSADKWRSINMPQHWGEKELDEPEFLFGSNNVFKKSAIAEVGYYNEKCGNNGEDYEMSQRLKEKGYLIVYQPKAVAYHLRKDNMLSVYRTHWNWYREWHRPYNLSNIIFRTKHNMRESKRRLLEDLKMRYYKIIQIDLLLTPYELFRDIGYWIRRRRNSN